MVTNELTKVCPYSGKKFHPKRNNQKFANDECRIAFHNHRNNKLRLERAKVDRHLHKNHKILVELMGAAEKRTFKRDFLAGKGFETGVLTGFEKLNDRWVHSLYNYVMIPIKEDTITIIRKGL